MQLCSTGVVRARKVICLDFIARNVDSTGEYDANTSTRVYECLRRSKTKTASLFRKEFKDKRVQGFDCVRGQLPIRLSRIYLSIEFAIGASEISHAPFCPNSLAMVNRLMANESLMQQNDAYCDERIQYFNSIYANFLHLNFAY